METLVKDYPFQAAAHEKIRGLGLHNGFALFSVPGTGKTKMAIDNICWQIENHFADVGNLVIFCPKAVCGQWQDEIDKFMNPYYTKKLRIMIKNYEQTYTKAFPEFVKVRLNEPFIMILDESHRVKNYRAKTHKIIRYLSELQTCKYRMLLTGTPIAKNLVDEWSQFNIIDPDIIGCKYVTVFRNRYCVMGGFQNKQIVGHRNIDQFLEKTKPYVYRVDKSVLKDLPAKVYKRVKFSLTEQQKRYINEIKEELMLMTKSDVHVVKNVLGILLRVQQITSGFIDKDEFMSSDKNPRLVMLGEMIKDIMEYENQQVIVWCRFRKEVEMVMESLAGYRTHQIVGGMSDKERQPVIDLWTKGEMDILVATPKSCGVGLNLQTPKCQNAIYYSHSDNFIDYEQSEDRIHRIGSVGDYIIYHHMVAIGGIDAKILRNLKNKKSFSSMVLGDIVQDLFE